jgi:hypothetical protein
MPATLELTSCAVNSGRCQHLKEDRTGVRPARRSARMRTRPGPGPAARRCGGPAAEQAPERYVYESFAGTDALPVAVLDRVVLAARDTLITPRLDSELRRSRVPVPALAHRQLENFHKPGHRPCFAGHRSPGQRQQPAGSSQMTLDMANHRDSRARAGPIRRHRLPRAARAENSTAQPGSGW